MEKKHRRYRFLKWLRKVFKVKEGDKSPKYIAWVYYILFPLEWFYQRQSGIKYDSVTDVYTIRGMIFSGDSLCDIYLKL